MKLLIVEDDPNKSRQLLNYLQDQTPQTEIRECRSYQSGLKEALNWRPHVIILDMTMPTYAITATELGGRPRAFAGREIIGELARKKIPSLVAVVTQFESFGEGEDKMTFKELARQLKEMFPQQYLGTVYYSAADERWKDELGKLLLSVARNGD